MVRVSTNICNMKSSLDVTCGNTLNESDNDNNNDYFIPEHKNK